VAVFGRLALGDSPAEGSNDVGRGWAGGSWHGARGNPAASNYTGYLAALDMCRRYQWTAALVGGLVAAGGRWLESMAAIVDLFLAEGRQQTPRNSPYQVAGHLNAGLAIKRDALHREWRAAPFAGGLGWLSGHLGRCRAALKSAGWERRTLTLLGAEAFRVDYQRTRSEARLSARC